MRALVTGLSGFAGRHLKPELENNGYEVFGLEENENGVAAPIDIRDSSKVFAAVERIKPEYIFHLAAQSIASESWKFPQKTLEVNVTGTANLLEAVRHIVPDAHVLIIGSSDEYGLAIQGGVPITEEVPLQPITPYAVSKCAQEYLGQVYAKTYGLKICMTRTFACGGGQHPKGVVLSDFAAGIAAVEAGKADALHVGNLDSERDFTHIKDVVRAYRLLCEKGISGEVYNVGSGIVYNIGDILQKMRALARCDIPVVQAASQKRPKDVRGASCNHDKLTSQTGWQPYFTTEQIICDELEYWRSQEQETTNNR